MKTYSPKAADITRGWYLVDAEGVVLGRLASEVAKILRGKHKPTFAPHVDGGDHVVVINAAKVSLSGGKESKKMAYRHSQYPGGLRAVPYERLLAERPERAVEKAIKGMLPKNRLGRQMGKKLRVYAGPDHQQQAQQPVPLKVGDVPPAVPRLPGAGTAENGKESSDG
ncbi:MAG TPA: 50S ribosomal protein L13 [Actinomycetota bacterium]|nr:50S ribosomal protein L13 [Actinomycetota bacterium]